MKRIIITLSAMAAIIACHGQRNASMPEITFTPQQKLHYAEKIIESYYVDDVNSDKIVQEAIVAMLKTLDPHSSYSDPEETKELTTPLEGNFSGIGIQFNRRPFGESRHTAGRPNPVGRRLDHFRSEKP